MSYSEKKPYRVVIIRPGVTQEQYYSTKEKAILCATLSTIPYNPGYTMLANLLPMIEGTWWFAGIVIPEYNIRFKSEVYEDGKLIGNWIDGFPEKEYHRMEALLKEEKEKMKKDGLVNNYTLLRKMKEARLATMDFSRLRGYGVLSDLEYAEDTDKTKGTVYYLKWSDTLEGARKLAARKINPLRRLNGHINDNVSKIYDKSGLVETWIGGFPEAEYYRMKAEQETVKKDEEKPVKSVVSFSWNAPPKK